MDAVEVLQLLIVEAPRARADALEAEALHDLRHAHDLGAAVVAPANQRQEVDQSLWDVALGSELLHRARSVTFGELLAVQSKDAPKMPVGRERRPKRLEDPDLLRRVRDVVVAAEDVRDPVEPVLDRRSEVVGGPAVGPDE